MKRNILRWFGHIESKSNEEFAKKVYASVIEDPRKRGRSVVRWKKDSLKQYMHERVAERGGGLELARR